MACKVETIHEDPQGHKHTHITTTHQSCMYTAHGIRSVYIGHQVKLTHGLIIITQHQIQCVKYTTALCVYLWCVY